MTLVLVGSSMLAWNELPLSDLRALAAFTTQLSDPLYQREPEFIGDDLAKTQQLFKANCTLCHGADGGGDGVQAAALAPSPTNFQDQIATLAYAENAIAKGIAGTAMPRWDGKLSKGDQKLLARYVRTLFDDSHKP